MIAQKDIPLALFTCKLSSSINKTNGAVDNSSFYTFGFVDQDTLKAANATDFTWTPINTLNGWWQVPSSSYYINGKQYQRKNVSNQAIMDTGTTLYIVDDDMCKQIYAAIPGAKNDPNYGWVFPASTKLAQLPNIQVQIGNALVNIDKRFYNYTFTDGSKRTCFGIFQSRGTFPIDIAGDALLRNVYSVSAVCCLLI